MERHCYADSIASVPPNKGIEQENRFLIRFTTVFASLAGTTEITAFLRLRVKCCSPCDVFEQMKFCILSDRNYGH